MRILVAATMSEGALDDLRGLGIDVDYVPDLPAEKLAQRLADISVLVVDRRRVSREAITAAPRLQMILRAGNSTANIAVEEASQQGVFVCNCNYRDASAIAELMLGQLIALDRQLLREATAARTGVSAPAHIGMGLVDRKLGLLGAGPVMQQLAIRAQACGMQLLGWADAAAAPEPWGVRGVKFCAWPRELAREADMVAIYAPQDSDTVVVNSEFIQSMPTGALLVHCGSTSVFDEAALVGAVREHRIRLASDLAEGDAGRIRSRLSALDDAVITHRLVGDTWQAREAIAREVIRVINHFLLSSTALNCVNLMERSPATWELVMRLKDAVGVVASIMDAVRADGINAEEITCRVFQGARAAWCSISLDERPSTDALNTIRNLPGVLHLELRAVV